MVSKIADAIIEGRTETESAYAETAYEAPSNGDSPRRTAPIAPTQSP